VARARLARAMVVAPRLYLDADASPIRDRGDPHPVCREATLTLVNPSQHRARIDLVVEFDRGHSSATGATIALGRRRIPLLVDEPTRLRASLRPGSTRAPITVTDHRVRCDNVERDDLPTVAAHLVRPSAG
jgi:hypothetical protein